MAQSNLPAPSAQVGKSLVNKFAERYSIDADKLLTILKGTAFKQQGDQTVTNEQMAALLVVADQYKLNPFTREIFAFPDKGKGIVPIVSVDGWARIINEHPMMDGLEFRESETAVKFDDNAKECPEWIEAVIYRKDRSRAIPMKEYLDECYRPAFIKGTYKIDGPWQSHTKRMLRHKALIQAARIAFGFAGIYEEDEARGFGWGNGPDIDIIPTPATYDTSPFNEAMAAHGVSPDDPDLAEFLRQAAEPARIPVDKVKVEAAADIEGFLTGFKVWIGKRKAQAQPTQGNKPQSKTEPTPAAEEEQTATYSSENVSLMVECPNTGEMVSRDRECQKCDKRETNCIHWGTAK